MRCVTLISAAAQKSWQAAAWWVSRKYPDVWGQKDLVDLQLTDARPLSDVSDQEIEELERLRLLQQAATVTTSHRVPRRTSGNGSAPPIIDVTPTSGHGQL